MLPADGPGDRSACLAEQRSRLAEQRSLACRRRAVGLDDQGARPDEEPLDGGRQRLPVTRTLVEIPVERAEDGREADPGCGGRAIAAGPGAEGRQGARVVVDAARRTGGLERVGRAGNGLTVARLGGVARSGRAAANRAGGLHRIDRARGRPSAAMLRRVARPRSEAANSRCGLERVRRAVVGDTVAALGHVTVAGCRPADRRALLVGGARGTRTRARLRDVTHAGGGPALEAGGLQDVGRAAVAHPVA